MAVLIQHRLLMSPRSKDLAAFIRRWQPEISKSTCSYFSFVRSILVFRFLKRKKNGGLLCSSIVLRVAAPQSYRAPLYFIYFFYISIHVALFSHLDAAL